MPSCPPALRSLGFVYCHYSITKIATMFVFDVRSGSTEGRRRMGERGGAMAVISLQKQPGTVGRDGSLRASPPILAAASLPTCHSGCRAVACDRDERLRPVLAARRGQPRARHGGHVRRRAGWVLQLRGEILLQIRCSCSEARSPMQFAIAQPDSCGSSRTAVRFTGSGWTAERSGWARIPNRLDRRSASFETAACAASSG